VASRLESNPEGGWLELEDAAALLEACGVPVLATRAANSAEEAVAVAEEIGFPVVLKHVPFTRHKSDVGVLSWTPNAEAVAKRMRDVHRLVSNGWSRAPTNDAKLGLKAIIGIAVDPISPCRDGGLGGVMTDCSVITHSPFRRSTGTAEAMFGRFGPRHCSTAIAARLSRSRRSHLGARVDCEGR